MPKPTYPNDIRNTLRGISDTAKDAWTGAQSRMRYAAIRAASIIIGRQVGNRITIDPDSGGAAAIRFESDQPGTSELRVVQNPDPEQDGDTVSLRSDVGNDHAMLQAFPTQAALWLSEAGEYTAHVGVGQNSSGDAVAELRTWGSPSYTQVIARHDWAGMRAYSGGSIVAAMQVQTSGDIFWTGTWVPSPRSMAQAVPPTDPGPDAPAEEQLAYLRRTVTAQAEELAEVRARVDEMPRFRRVNPDDLDNLDPAGGDDGD